MKAHWFRRVLLLAGLLCLATGMATAQQYTMVHPGITGLAETFGLNNQGDFVSYNNPINTGMRYTGGVATYLFNYLNPVAINNNGQIAMNGVNGFTVPDSYIYGTINVPYPPFVITYVVDIGKLSNSGYAAANAMNDSGTIVGDSNISFTVYHAFVYSYSSNHMSDLGTLGTNSSARAINNSGQIVGESLTAAGYRRAFQMVNGIMTDLDPANPAYDSYATGINDAGQIVVVTNKAWHLVQVSRNKLLWVAYRGSIWYTLLYNGGVLTDLGNLGLAAGTFGASINTGGDVVGMTNIALGSQRAFLYHAGSMLDLNSRVSNLAGWRLVMATNINDWGQILCVGYSPDGHPEIVLLTPSGPPV